MSNEKNPNLVAYEKNYDLIAHYSGLLHKGRLEFILLSLLVWAYILGIRPGVLSFKVELFENSISGIAPISYMSSIFIMMLSLMEIAYYKRYFNVIRSGIALEKELNIKGYFRGFKSAFLWPFLSFNIAVSVGLFMVSIKHWLPIFIDIRCSALILNFMLVAIWGAAFWLLCFSAKGLVSQKKSIALENNETAFS